MSFFKITAKHNSIVNEGIKAILNLRRKKYISKQKRQHFYLLRGANKKQYFYMFKKHLKRRKYINKKDSIFIHLKASKKKVTLLVFMFFKKAFYAFKSI